MTGVGSKSSPIIISDDEEDEIAVELQLQPSGELFEDNKHSQRTLPDHTNNIGYKMLLGMGYTPGRGLGRALDGEVHPIGINLKRKLNDGGVGFRTTEVEETNGGKHKKKKRKEHDRSQHTPSTATTSKAPLDLTLPPRPVIAFPRHPSSGPSTLPGVPPLYSRDSSNSRQHREIHSDGFSKKTPPFPNHAPLGFGLTAQPMVPFLPPWPLPPDSARFDHLKPPLDHQPAQISPKEHIPRHPLPARPNLPQNTVATAPVKAGAPIGMPPDPRRGLYELALPFTPDPSRTLVMENIPDKSRNVGFIRDWLVRLGSKHQRVHVDSKRGKALFEVETVEMAQEIFYSKKMKSKGKKAIQVWRYRPWGGVVSSGAEREIEEGEVEEEDFSFVPVKLTPKPKKIPKTSATARLQRQMGKATLQYEQAKLHQEAEERSTMVQSTREYFASLGASSSTMDRSMAKSDDGLDAVDGDDRAYNLDDEGEDVPLQRGVEDRDRPRVPISPATGDLDMETTFPEGDGDDMDMSPTSTRDIVYRADSATSSRSGSHNEEGVVATAVAPTISTGDLLTYSPRSLVQFVPIPFPPVILTNANSPHTSTSSFESPSSTLPTSSADSSLSTSTLTDDLLGERRLDEKVTQVQESNDTMLPSSPVYSPFTKYEGPDHKGVNGTMMETNLRRLVLESKKNRLNLNTVNHTSTPPDSSSSITPYTASPTSSTNVIVQSTAFTQASNAASTLEDLAISFIAESIQAAQPAAPKPASSNAKLQLALKQQRLQQYITESKALMTQLGQAGTKQEKDRIMGLIRERNRMMELDTEPPSDSVTTPSLSHPGNPRRICSWPESQQDCVLIISDDEDDED